MTTKTITLEDINRSLTTLSQLCISRFKSIDERFDGVDARFTKVDERFISIEVQFKDLKYELYDIQHQLRETNALSVQMYSRVLGIESDIKEIYDRLVYLEQVRPPAASLGV